MPQVRLRCECTRKPVMLRTQPTRTLADDMGVFIDWASLYQRDPGMWRDWMVDSELFRLSDEELRVIATEGTTLVEERAAYHASRSPDETAAFRRALTRTMDLWYGHASTTVVMLTEFPAELVRPRPSAWHSP